MAAGRLAQRLCALLPTAAASSCECGQLVRLQHLLGSGTPNRALHSSTSWGANWRHTYAQSHLHRRDVVWRAASRHKDALRMVSTRASAQAQAQAQSLRQRNRTVAVYMTAIVAGMLGLSYFSVPLYRLFCSATGYGGTVSRGATVEEKLRKRAESPDVATEEAAAKREITVTFVSEVQPGLPWTFEPCQRQVKVRPGQSTLVFYNATNHSDADVVGVSTYNVAPAQVGWFFNKIQCFCFEEQRLRPRESIDMPVFFYIDPEFATDRRLRNVDHITLSYVFFRTGELPTHADGSALTPGESMPAHLLPSRAGGADGGGSSGGSSGTGGAGSTGSGDSGSTHDSRMRQGSGSSASGDDPAQAATRGVTAVQRAEADPDPEEREAAAAVA